MDPRTRLILLAVVGTLAVLLDRPAALGLLAAVSAAALLAQDIGQVWRARALALAIGTVWSTALSQGLFYSDHPRVPLVSLGPVVVWREGVTYGLIQSLRMLATAFAGLAVAVSTAPDRLLAGLVSLRVPAVPAFLAVTALRFVPVVSREWQTVRMARAARGRPLSGLNPWARLRTEILLLRPVVARTIRRARTLAESLDARGFDPAEPRLAIGVPRFARWEPPLIGAAIMLVVMIAGLQALTLAYLWEIAYHPSLRPLYGLVRTWL
ncbi:MAG: energy-coupling factor transport system permease protein [Myxococcota bacterium]|jgi:energy-coupling factor transport system permease protein